MPAPRSAPLVVVGAGLSGLAVALGAALHDRPVAVFESADQVGGAAAYSGGQVWVGANQAAARSGIADRPALAETYVRGLAREHPELLDEDAMLRWLEWAPQAMQYWEDVGAVTWSVIAGLADYHAELEGALPSGRYLTGVPFDGRRLGEWRARLRVSPYFRPGTTYEEMFAEGRRAAMQDREAEGDPLALGTGLVAGFLAKVIAQPGIELLLSTPAVELLQDERGAVIGVRAQGPDGEVVRQGEVVLATSSFDWDPTLVKELIGLGAEDFGSMAPESIRGDGLRLARSVGAGTVRMPATSVPMVPGWRRGSTGGYDNGPEYAMPHAMIVNRSGRRFCNDSYWVDLVNNALTPGQANLPFFLVWDEQHRLKYGLGETRPGGTYPAGMVTSADSLRELGERLGVDGDQLETTAASFSLAAAEGLDPEHGRGAVEFINRFSGDPSHHPSPVLGPIDHPPYYGMRLVLLGTAIGLSGVHTDPFGRALDEAGAVLPGLYAIGSCAATTTFGSGYNSGMALSRGLTLAYSLTNQPAADPPPGSKASPSIRVPRR